MPPSATALRTVLRRNGRRRSYAASVATVLALSSTGLLLLPGAAQAADTRLGTADRFAVLAGSTITNSGRTVIAGDVGVHPGSAVTGFEPCAGGAANCVDLTGTQHVANDVARQAKADQLTAYNALVGLESTCTSVPVELGRTTLTPGVYCSPTFGLTGTVTLDGPGEYIFLTGAGGSTLTTAVGSQVLLINGADACNIYWQVASSATIGASSAFAGNILAKAAISFGAGATLTGSALAETAEVTLISNTITDSQCAAAVPPPVDTTPVDTGTPTIGTPTTGTPTGTPSTATDTPTTGTGTGTPTTGTPRTATPTAAPELPRTGWTTETLALIALSTVALGIFLTGLGRWPAIYRLQHLPEAAPPVRSWS